VSVPAPVLGPCSPWITGADVAAYAGTEPEGGSGLLDGAALDAGMALFEISGRQFTGMCERTVRPAQQPCGCFGASGSAGFSPWSWGSGAGGWAWRNECGDQIGCQPMSRVKLAGYPVREVVLVKIDGAAVDPLTYRLDNWRYLTRLDDPGPPLVQRLWPGCQDMSLDDSQLGTFSVSYLHGIDPPQLGKDAAAQLAWHIYKSGPPAQQADKLPTGATRVQRQGVTVERGLFANWFDASKPTGLVYVDLFLKAYWPTRAIRPPAVFSPDRQKFARPVG
jgi:hypothetical protein